MGKSKKIPKGTSGQNGESNPQQFMTTIKKYHFTGKYPKPRNS